MSIRTRLTIFYGSLFSIVVVLASGALFWTERHLLLAEMEKSRQTLLASFSQNCRDALLVRDELSAINAVLSVGKMAGVKEALCVDPSGKVVAHSNPARRKTRYVPPPAVYEPLSETVQKGRWTDPKRGPLLGLFMDIPMGPGAPARAVIVFSEKTLNDEVNKALAGVGRRIAFVFSGALLAGLVGTVLLARSLTRPLLRIAAGTHQLAQGNLGHRVDWRGNDEIGQLAGDFNVMAERLGELDRMKNDFVSNVTHELRSPLSAIESYANLVTEDWRNGRSQNLVDYLTIVRNNATRLRQFVTDILDLSKIDAGAVELEKESFVVGELFQEIVDLFQAKAREKEIHLSAGAPAGFAVSADMDKVRQILTNLVGNALKFTPVGGRVTLLAESSVRPGDDARLTQALGRSEPPGREDQVSQAGRRQGQKKTGFRSIDGAPPGPGSRTGEETRFTRLTVTDTGVGIAEKDQARIFDRFEQVKEMRETVEGQKGTGLGLSIVRQLVAAHGGVIALASQRGKGTAFFVYLPEES